MRPTQMRIAAMCWNLDLDVLQRSGNWKEDLEHDVLVVRFMWDSKLMEGVQVKYTPPSGPAMVPFPSVLRLHDITLQKAVYLAGYRVSLIPRGAETVRTEYSKDQRGKGASQRCAERPDCV
jgi:hypothetical protein